MVKQRLKTGAEYDLVFGKKFYCYLKRGSSSIKKQLRKRLRRENKFNRK
jgi:hypothetical protein